MGTYSEQYQYDAVGNFLNFIHKGANPSNPGWTRAYTYNEASLLEAGKLSNRLSSTAVSGSQPLNEPYAYDLHGNMARMPQLQVMQWDFKDQLIMSQRQAVNANDQDGTLHQGERTYYVYDAAGQRVRKTTESSAGIRTKERLYLGGFELYREYDAGGNIKLARETLHVMEDNKRIALVETKTVDSSVPSASLPSPTTRYQFDNHLGSASLELDETAAVISYEEYYPYGSTSYQAGRSLAELSVKRYRYTGKERDEETGLNYHGARYFAPWLGRWVSCDPAYLSDGTNLYRYALDNPLKQSDPTGMNSVDPTDAPMDEATRAARAKLEAAKAETRQLEAKLPELEAKVQKLADRLRTAKEGLQNLEKSESRGISGWIEKRGAISGQKDIIKALEKELDVTTRELMVDIPEKIEALKHEALVQESFLEKPESAGAEADRALRTGTKKPKGGGGEGEGGGGSGGAGGGTSGGGGATPPAEKPGGGATQGGEPRVRPSPSAELTILDALGALGAANAIVTVISGKDPLQNFSDLVLGGLRIDPEARLRFGEGLQITAEDRRAAEAQSIKRQVNEDIKTYAKNHGISEDEARRLFQQAARQGPKYPEIGPAR